jgi:hypothetical protein
VVLPEVALQAKHPADPEVAVAVHKIQAPNKRA